MKNLAIVIALVFSVGMLKAQENTEMVEKGTVLTLGETTVSGYQHIDFPRKNFIIKRGAIANFSNLQGKKVVVEEVLSKDGTTEVVLERQDGQRFFRFWPSVKADLQLALNSGELKISEKRKLNSLAR